jgi:isochorismate synthase
MSTPELLGVVTENLRRLLDRRVGQSTPASHGAEPVLISTTIVVPAVDPLAVFQRARAAERALWEQARDRFSLVAIGAATRLVGQGHDRFSDVTSAWRNLVSHAVVDVPHGYPLRAPVCLGGFSFDADRKHDPEWAAYPDALLIVPRILCTWRNGSSWVTINVLATRDTDATPVADETAALLSALFAPDGATPDDADQNGLWRPASPSGVGESHRRGPGGTKHDATTEATVPGAPEGGIEVAPGDDVAARGWRDAVRGIIDDIRCGTVEKQVLARRVRVRTRGALDPGAVLQGLRARYGASCTVFAIAQDDACFLGASPERLVRLDGRSVRADGLAGSIGRGTSAEEDRTLRETLRANAKECHEHALVVRALSDALAPLCRMVSIPEQPTVLQMPNVQHLHTPIEGVLTEEVNILELVERLHPTPAGGGLPREAVMSRIGLYEPFDRGWYAGPVGWVDGHGSGEFAVAIRSGLVKGGGTKVAEGRSAAGEATSRPAGQAAREALLYAGCGIVVGSDPDAEYRESSLKLRPLLWAINQNPQTPQNPQDLHNLAALHDGTGPEDVQDAGTPEASGDWLRCERSERLESSSCPQESDRAEE